MALNGLLCISIVTISLLSISCAADGAVPAGRGSYSVMDFGAKGDARTDDTSAFQKAVDKASAVGGYVIVPPLGPGRGYVITRTVRLKPGVSLVGCPAGFGNDSWAAYDLPEKHVHGAKILARPARSDYSSAKKKPLFSLEGGNTVRGLWILYDQQPWPTDQEFQNPQSRFHYASFDQARDNFFRDHVKPCGPTFYLARWAVNVVLEDIACDRYYDFYFQAGGGKNLADRIYLYGYHRGFTIKESAEVNRISNVQLSPNVGPACPGNVGGGKSYSWIYGITVSQPECVGVQIGRSDGYLFRDLFFFGVHTGVRFGASKEYPLVDPVEGTECYYDPAADRLSGFSGPYKATGPWGSISTLYVDCCAIGIHLVWPSPNCSCMLTNAYLGTASIDGREFEAVAGTGAKAHIAAQGAVVVEPSYCAANNNGVVPTLMCSNAEIVSYSPTSVFAGASAHAAECNGRALLIGGDILAEFSNVRLNRPYDADHIYAAGPKATRYSVRMRGVIQADEPMPDLSISPKGMSWQESER